MDESDQITSPVRPLEAGDHASWLPLWVGYQAFYNVHFAETVTDTTWRRLQDPAEPMWAALAWSDGVAVGLVHWVYHRSTWTTSDYCYLQDLFVDPSSRGAAFGRLLIDHVYREADRAGSARVYWLTHETNRQAMRLYDKVAERSGFVQYHKQLGS